MQSGSQIIVIFNSAMKKISPLTLVFFLIYVIFLYHFWELLKICKHKNSMFLNLLH